MEHTCLTLGRIMQKVCAMFGSEFHWLDSSCKATFSYKRARKQPTADQLSGCPLGLNLGTGMDNRRPSSPSYRFHFLLSLVSICCGLQAGGTSPSKVHVSKAWAQGGFWEVL